jgi:hypothetical protein
LYEQAVAINRIIRIERSVVKEYEIFRSRFYLKRILNTLKTKAVYCRMKHSTVQ